MPQSRAPCRTIVFIHGNFVSKHSWRRWVEHYEARGYACHAPASGEAGGRRAHSDRNTVAGSTSVALRPGTRQARTVAARRAPTTAR